MISSLKLKQVRKQYGSGQFALNIDNLEFHNRSIQVIVGPNGSGKSTLLNLIAFLDTPDQGNILLEGRPVPPGNNGLNKLRKRIGFIRQSPYLFNLDVFENVALGLKLRKVPKTEIISKVNNMLSTLKIAHLTSRSVKSLSRGEYQKVAIAQVLVIESEIILMDEPAANIDRQSTLSIEETIKNFQKKFKALIIMTTHSLTQAYRISPDIISLGEGKIIDFVHENVFFGQITESSAGLQLMSVAKNIEIILSTQKRGDAYIAIDPENIIISKEQPKTSARNAFSGKIIKIESLGSNVRILVDVGVQMYSIITRQSFQELGINLGSSIVINFKVNSVKVI